MLYKVLLFVGVVFNVVAQYSLRMGMKQLGPVDIGRGLASKLKAMILNPYLILGLLSYGMGFLLYAIVLSKMELSKAYPVSSVTAIILISVVSAIFLREELQLSKILGVSLCVAGIFLIFK